jgi:hypothetical protein
MISEHFKRRLCIRVVCWLEFQICYTDFLIECFNNSLKIREAYIPVSNETLALMELSQMSLIERLIPENSINGEVFNRLEFFLLSKFVKHL